MPNRRPWPKLSFGLIPALALLLLLSGCGPTGTRTDAPPPVDPVAERIAAGDLRAAAEEYERLAKSERKLREHYQLLAARTWRDEGDFVELQRVLVLVKLKRLDAGQRLEYDLLSAELAVNAQDFEQALALLVMPELPEQERARQLELRARAEAGLNRPLEAARTRLALAPWLSADERSGNIDEMISELGKLPAASLLSELAALDAAAPMRPYVEVMLQRQKLTPPRVALPANELLDTTAGLDSPAHRPVQKIALLVPTRGEFAAAGEVIRDGFLAAHFARKDAGKVQVFDTGANRKSALAAFQSAIDAGFTQFVGPLERDQVDAVLQARKPQHRVLTLNHAPPGSLSDIDVYRFALAPENDGAAAAESMVGAALKRFIIIGTEEEWSQRVIEAFRVQAEAMGATIVGQARIKSGLIDFAESLAPATAMFRPAPIAAAAETTPLAAPIEPVAPHDFGVDGVFIAVRATDARLLVPQIKVRGLDVLPIVAAPQIFASAQSALDADLNGVSFLDAPWAHNQGDIKPTRLELIEFLPSALQSPRLFAFGMDAYTLVGYLDYLRAHQGSQMPAANGRLRIDPQGRVRRTLSWYRYDNGQPVSQELLPARP